MRVNLSLKHSVSGNLSLAMSHSTNDATYTSVASTMNTAAGTANAWTSYTYNFTVSASVANNGYFYLYLEGFNPNGYQFCDEFGIDNVTVTGRNF